MAFTQADADAVRAHIVARLSGAAAQRVRFADREVELDTIDEARKLLAEIEADLAAQATGTTTRYAAHSKGLSL